MKHRLGISLIILGGMAMVAFAGEPPKERDITGTYAGSGTDIGGQQYKVTVEIEKEKDAYQVKWISPNGQGWFGVGIRTGDTLSVSWAGRTDKGVMVGVMVYRIKKDGTLEGTWSMLGAKGVVRTETLTPEL